MLKILGICILLFTIFCVSSTACEKERARISLMGEMSKFIHAVRRTLAVSMKPMSEVCRDFKADEPYFASLLKDAPGCFSDAARVNELCERVGVGGADIFVNFINGFGRGYLSDELARCDLAVNEFDALYGAEKSSASRKQRLCRTLGVASSFALVILFI